MLKSACAAFTLLFALSACTAATAAPEATDKNASALRASDPVADISGTWAFDLDASDVAAAAKQECASTAAGDAAKRDDCWKAISEQAKREKIRFSKPSASGRAVWTSLERAGKTENVFVEVPVDLVSDGPNHLLWKVAGKAKGSQAEPFEKSSTNVLRIEVVDETTIAVVDPKKGRLVYTKERP